MPKATQKTGILSKLGDKARKAFESHKNDETNYGQGGDLPPGIERGIARLVECKFGIYEKGDFAGQPFFLAAGVVVEPKKFKDPQTGASFSIEGARTQIGPEALCDTPNKSRKTTAEHVKWVCNELRKLGCDTASLEYDELENTVAALKEQGPYFNFRTWIGKKQKPSDPEPRVQHQWKGLCDYDPETASDAADDVQDDSAGDGGGGGGDDGGDDTAAEAEEEEPDYAALGESADAGDDDAIGQLTELARTAGYTDDDINGVDTWTALAEALADAEAEEGEEEEGEEEGEVDLTALGASADEGEDDAIETLTNMAAEADLDPDTYDTWAALAEALAETPEEEQPEEEEFAPSKGDVVLYKGPKDKKAVEHEVIAVVPAEKLASVKNLTNKTIYKMIPWDKLSAPA